MTEPAAVAPVRVEVAPADFDRWATLLDLLQASFAYMDGRIDPPSSLHALGVADLQAKAREETLIVATEGDALVGCAYAALRPGCVYVGKLAVAARMRGRGLARQIMACAEGVARAQGRAFLELQTRIELIENHATFAALGFETVAKTAHAGYDRPTSITMRRRVGTETA